MNTRGQSALEFITTYGWSILVVLIAISALAYFGVLDLRLFLPSKCVVDVGLVCSDFTVGSNAVNLILANSLGWDITISSIKMEGCQGAFSGPKALKNGHSGNYTIGLCSINQKKYAANVNVTYTLESGIPHTSKGQIISANDFVKMDYDYIGNGNNISGSVSAYDFNEGDGYSISDRALTNNGIFYGNTRLLMHLDGNAIDSSPYHNDGTINGNVNCNAAGIYGNGCAFDGVNSYIEVPNSLNLNLTGNLSAVAWVKVSSNSNGFIITKGIYPDYNYKLEATADGKFQAIVGIDGQQRIARSTDNYELNRWYEVTLTYDGSFVNLYVDGSLNANTFYSGVPAQNNYPVIIGKYYGGPGYFFNGTIDEAAIYSKALSSQEITQIYQSKKAKFTDWVAGKYGTALEYDGKNTYTEVLAEQSLDITNKITLEAWIKLYELTGNADQDMIMNKEGIPYEIAVHDNTGPEEYDPNDPVHTRKTCDKPGDLIPPYNFAWYLGGLSGLPSHNCGWKDGGGPIQKNVWTYLAVTYNGSLVKTFINGVKQKEYPASGTIQTTNRNLRMGARSSGGTPPPQSDYGALFNGVIDSLAVYKDALSEQLIAQHANS